MLIGPYSYLAGAISLDFGGKRGGATACGLIDGVGYLFGGVVAGKVVSSMSQSLGWQGVFKMLAGVALLDRPRGRVLSGRPVATSRAGRQCTAGARGRLTINNARGQRHMTIVQTIMNLFDRRGATAYHGESVSQAEHALQAAYLAEQSQAPDALVVAALLHDVGHLLDGQDEDLAGRGFDGRHEEAGCAWLATNFGPEVTEPIRLHVAAKRYLCAVSSSYLDGLSPASRLSLSLQGGDHERRGMRRVPE